MISLIYYLLTSESDRRGIHPSSTGICLEGIVDHRFGDFLLLFCDLLKAAALALRRRFLRRYRCAIASLTLSQIRNLIAVHQQLGLQPEAAKESYAREGDSESNSTLGVSVFPSGTSITSGWQQAGFQS